jgi:hypothetical protein
MVLAAALARVLEVRHAFPDGIFWQSVGQRPDVLALQNQLLRQLKGSKETSAEVGKECSYLPLALAMIGTMIRLRPTAWKDALRRLQERGSRGD